MPEKFPPIIRLNVGGMLYMTRLSTVCKYPDSMLAAMFSGRHHVDKDQDDNYFLDSNGSLFGYILDFLRFGQLPPNTHALPVYREASYFGLHALVERLQLNPEIAKMTVKEAHRAQFPNYSEVKENVIKMAIDNATINKIGEVIIYVFRTEFVAKAPSFNPNHGCVTELAHVSIGPWTSMADEETFMRCLETDLLEEGFTIRPHDTKRKCKYYFGQTCQKFVYRLQFIFD
ncbi:BTB/POZ domain-containing protein KCTD7-like [Liolophura sinensis]|uniref:BTB/POZ domain-containing protein KCTD7-like n=1 Tax=Liolophura sinensis TaxID=3198878 RepID=UPI00315900B3